MSSISGPTKPSNGCDEVHEADRDHHQDGKEEDHQEGLKPNELRNGPIYVVNISPIVPNSCFSLITILYHMFLSKTVFHLKYCFIMF